MTIEEKAKAYDEAIERAKKVLLDCTSEERKVVEYISPELAESEDERIRKELIRMVKEDWPGRNDVIAWLEKQGEQKPSIIIPKFRVGDTIRLKNSDAEYTITEILDGYYRGKGWCLDIAAGDECGDYELVEQNPADKVEPKFKVGDFIVNDYCMGRIVEITNDAYLLDTEQGIPFSCHSTRLWDITKDANAGDVLCYKDEISLYRYDIKNCTKQETTFGGFVYYCCYDGKRFVVDSLYSLTEQDKMNIHPATKEQSDQLEKAMADAGYRWNPDEKKMEKIEQMPWSEEDEDNFKHLVDEIVCLGNSRNSANRLYYDRLIKFLGELKDRAQPREEWCETDERKLDRLIAYFEDRVAFTDKDDLEYAEWLKSLKDRVRPKQEWSEYDNMMFASIMNVPGLDEQQKEWLATCNPQPKQEWSDNDEKMLTTIVDYIISDNVLGSKYIDFLKSLRLQNTWKPSDEMLEALYRVIPENVMEISEDEMLLDKLYQGLKYGRVLSKM